MVYFASTLVLTNDRKTHLLKELHMRRGFTMIELIFVIVIIGILAAVAIPKLAGTRDDAKMSAEIANAKTCLSDVQAHYTAQGNLTGFSSDACTKAAAGSVVTATVTTTVGSESVVIAGAPASVGLNGTYNNFSGTSVSYN
jgi:prepilin-type N-terminal cleavage/methylation domain-containing protein